MRGGVVVTAIALWSMGGLVHAELISGMIGMEQSYFSDDPGYAGQKDNNSQDLVFEPEIKWHNESGQSIAIRAFLRAGSDDDERNHADIRELRWSYNTRFVDLNAGVDVVYWGVTESWHLVNVINQVDMVESIYQDKKLGQTLVSAAFVRDWGTVSVYWLPVFRERNYPGIEGRNRTPQPVDYDNAIYLYTDKYEHHDYAFRYSHHINAVDIGLHWFEGIGREPSLVINASGDYLNPVYSKVRQLGLDAQYTTGAWLWKLESISNNNIYDNYFASVAGFEYTVFQLFDSKSDIGFLLEYLYDSRGKATTVFGNDVFLGTRIALNDTQDTSILLGAIIDIDTRESVVKLEFSRRLGESITLEANGSYFSRADHSFSAFEKDSMLSLRLNWHF